MNRLTEIANKYNTDKGTVPNNIGSCHGFTEFYYNYFKDLKKPVILEIGVWEGGSIKMFNEFYECDCEIYCIDIDPKCDVSNLYDNVHFYLVDQGNERQLNDFVSSIGDVKFDIILDDGSHHISHQMLTYSILRKLLKPDGIYVMEDLHTSFSEAWPGYLNGNETTTFDFFTNLTPYSGFSDELNLELFNEIQSFTLFSNDNHSHPGTLDNLRRNRSVTGVIKLKH